MFHKFSKTLLAMVPLIGLFSVTSYAQTKSLAVPRELEEPCHRRPR